MMFITLCTLLFLYFMSAFTDLHHFGGTGYSCCVVIISKLICCTYKAFWRFLLDCFLFRTRRSELELKSVNCLFDKYDVSQLPSWNWWGVSDLFLKAKNCSFFACLVVYFLLLALFFEKWFSLFGDSYIEVQDSRLLSWLWFWNHCCWSNRPIPLMRTLSLSLWALTTAVGLALSFPAFALIVDLIL